MKDDKEESPLILIVDDNATNVDILETALENEYRLGIAMNGQAALDFARKNNPQLILLDIVMPGMDGFEVMRQLQESPETKKITVILVTALSDTEQKIRGFECGAVDYITKPFIGAEVDARVKTHLALVDYRNRLEEKVLERTRQLEEAHQRFKKMEGLLASIQTASLLNNQIEQHLQTITKHSKANQPPDKIITEVNSISTLIHEILDKVSHSYNTYAEMEHDSPQQKIEEKEF